MDRNGRWEPRGHSRFWKALLLWFLSLIARRAPRQPPAPMETPVAGAPVTLIIKAPNQKYTDQTISCYLDWTVGRLKCHLSKVYPSKPVSPSPFF